MLERSRAVGGNVKMLTTSLHSEELRPGQRVTGHGSLVTVCCWWFRHDHLLIGGGLATFCFAGVLLCWRWAIEPLDYLTVAFWLVMGLLFTGVAWLGSSRGSKEFERNGDPCQHLT